MSRRRQQTASRLERMLDLSGVASGGTMTEQSGTGEALTGSQVGQRSGVSGRKAESVRSQEGLHKLMGAVKYPAQATPARSSVSPVRENRMHGLKGEIRNGL